MAMDPGRRTTPYNEMLTLQKILFGLNCFGVKDPEELVCLVLAVEPIYNLGKMISDEKTGVSRTILHLPVTFFRAVRIHILVSHAIALAAHYESRGRATRTAAALQQMTQWLPILRKTPRVTLYGTGDAEEMGDEAAPEDDEACADEGAENLNGKQYMALDEEIAEEEAECSQDGEGECDGENIEVGVGESALGASTSQEACHDPAPKADEEIAEETAEEIDEKAGVKADDKVGVGFVLTDFRDDDDNVKEVDGTKEDLGGPEDESLHGDEDARQCKDWAEAKESQRGEPEVAEVIEEEEVKEITEGEDCADRYGCGGWEAAGGGADGEAEEDALEAEYYEEGEGTTRASGTRRWRPKTKRYLFEYWNREEKCGIFKQSDGCEQYVWGSLVRTKVKACDCAYERICDKRHHYKVYKFTCGI
ncbi:hypothetical protein MTO96_032542 [Rhipicephalus appendiculatus]